MSALRMPALGLRLEQTESNRLVWAFAISIAVHLLLVSTYEAGRKLGWWEHWHWPAWVQSAKMLTQMLNKKPPGTPLSPAPLQQLQEPPLMFVDVNPAVATAEPPKTTPYYSDKNSQAANPDADKNADTPKITGKQTDMVRTEDVPRSQAFPLQPTPATTQAKEDQDEVKPKPAYTPGDLALAKPNTIQRTEPGEGEHAKPKTVAEALARLPNSRLAGQKMKQEGGVRNRQIESSLDVLNSPFGAYDGAIIAAVQNRWYDLLDSRNWAADRTGKVTLKFHLNSDGTVSELTLVENTVDLALAMLCQSAIKDPSPYRPWPSEMKRTIGSKFRDITFTFYYY